MQVLCVDIGNTSIKFARLSLPQTELIDLAVIKYRTADDAAAVMQSIIGGETIEQVYIASVASPEVTQKVTDCLTKRYINNAYVIRVEDNYNALKLAYTQPETLGVDRWLAMLAVKRRCDTVFCVIDSGTAITLDVVDAEGCHQGGIILPGEAMMKKALSQILPGLQFEVGKKRLLADNTVDAVVSGVNYSLLGGLDRAMREIQSRYSEVQFYISGGNSQLLDDSGIGNLNFEKELVLEGVGLIAQQMNA